MTALDGYLSRKPYDAHGHLVRGYNLRFSGDRDGAEAAFARVLEIEAAAASKARPNYNDLQELEKRWLAHVAIGQEIVTYLRAAYDQGKPESMRAPRLGD